jgi:hypothetical protein
VTRLATEVVESSQQPQRRRTPAWARSPQAITLYCYVLGALFVTARLWLDPAGRRQVGDPDDVNQATWFIRYTAAAVQHFRLPALLTTAMNAPHGVNLMWNTSLLLPGVLVSPITWLFGPQVSLTVLLVIGFAGSAASMFYVLRRWHASILAAALGGALYGFSPALVNSGIGHYSLVLAMLPPLMIDRVLRLVTRQGSPLRNGIWLGLLAAGQFFISEETLVDAVIAVLIFLVVLAISRPRSVVAAIPPVLIGLGSAAVIAIVLCARGLWVQFHGIATHGAAATVIIQYNGRMTNLGTLPYALITPSSSALLHSSGTAYIAAGYPQPQPEYLAYLGVPMIILLLAAVVYFWRNIVIRAAGLTCIALEWLAMGSKPILAHIHTLPAFLLPWHFFEHVPVISGMVPDRLCILADAAAAVVLAFAFDLARSGVKPFVNWQNGAKIAAGVAIAALVPLIPAPYGVVDVNPLPPGWQATYTALHLTDTSRVLLAPFPYAGTSQMVRWQAVTGVPKTMNGGDFIAPDMPGRKARAGRAGLTPFTCYLNYLYKNQTTQAMPSVTQIRADLALMKPSAVMAVTKPSAPLGQFLIKLFGTPATHIGKVLGWNLTPAQVAGNAALVAPEECSV